MRIHLQKRAIRCFGVAESFRKGLLDASILSGTVMRADLVIDGVVLGKATLGGDDATRSIISMFKGMRRKDVNVIMVGGSIVSLFNIVDVDGLYESLKVPVISLTYRPSEGLEEHIKRHFVGEPSKLEAYRRLGERHPMILHTGKKVYVRCAGINDQDAKGVIDKFTLQGALPEPIRVARLLSRASLNFLSSKST
ncbi:MAG: endonuclease dU [Nitrososphaeria archaeon]